MRKVWSLLLALSLALSLTACGQTKTPPVAAGSGAASSAAIPAITDATTAATTDAVTSATTDAATGATTDASIATPTDRDVTGTVTMQVEGLTQEAPATLYAGNGWSLYIPDKGWTAPDVDREDGEIKWDSRDNREVEFGVQTYSKTSAEDAFKWFSADEEDTKFDPLTGGVATGHDARDAETIWLRIVTSGDSAYLFWAKYPDAAIEGFGARTQAIGNTLMAS